MTLPKPKTKAGFFALKRETWKQLDALAKGLPRAAWTEPGAAARGRSKTCTHTSRTG